MTPRHRCENHQRLHAVPRGLLRLVIARLLESQEMSGIDIIRVLEERSKGVWRPSPGSIYPLLAQMENEGYIETIRVEGRSKTYRLSSDGEALLAKVRLHKENLVKKMRIGPLFWLGLLEPTDRIDAYSEMIVIAAEHLKDTFQSLETRQRKRVVKSLRESQRVLEDLVTEIERGGKNH